MPLVPMKPMLAAARRSGYAVGAFNILDYNSARAVVQAAEQLSAPAIVQTSVKTVKFWAAPAIAAWMRQLTANSPVPVALHLDHCTALNVIEPCILTKKVLQMAEPAGVSVEAELGEIGGVEDDMKVADKDAHLVDPEKAIVFCQMPLAVLAPAIGTARGIYKSKPKIAFDRLDLLFRWISMPFALHGGTGLTDDVFHRCIKLGCAKVYISTQLKHSFIDAFVEYHLAKGEYEPLKPLGAQLERITQDVVELIRKFSGEGHADDFQSQPQA